MSTPQVGVSYAADGSTPSVSPPLGQQLETLVQQAHAKYDEAVSRGRCFSAVNATARSPQASLTTTAPLVLYNPLGSGVRIKLMKVTFSHGATGTQGTGVIHHTGF